MSRNTRPNGDHGRLVAEEELILEATEAVVKLLGTHGLTRQELASRLGKTKGFVSHLLSGERNMTLRSLADMGYVLGHRFRVVAEPISAGSYAQRREARAPVVGPDRLSGIEHGCRSPARGRAVERRTGRQERTVSVVDWRRLLSERQEHSSTNSGADSHEWALNG